MIFHHRSKYMTTLQFLKTITTIIMQYFSFFFYIAAKILQTRMKRANGL